MVACLFLAITALSPAAMADTGRSDGLVRGYPGGDAIGDGHVVVQGNGGLHGKLTISGYWGTETWTYDVEPVSIVWTQVAGPFRGIYEGMATLVGDGRQQFISIEADLHPGIGMYTDGSDAYYNIESGIPEYTRHVYFDGLPEFQVNAASLMDSYEHDDTVVVDATFWDYGNVGSTCISYRVTEYDSSAIVYQGPSVCQMRSGFPAPADPYIRTWTVTWDQLDNDGNPVERVPYKLHVDVSISAQTTDYGEITGSGTDWDGVWLV